MALKPYTYRTLRKPIEGYKVAFSMHGYDSITRVGSIRLYPGEPRTVFERDVLIVKCIIPAGARVFYSSASYNDQCRTDMATITGIYKYSGIPYYASGIAVPVHYTYEIARNIRDGMAKSCAEDKYKKILHRYKRGDAIVIPDFCTVTLDSAIKRFTSKFNKINSSELIKTIATQSITCAGGFHFFLSEKVARDAANNLIEVGAYI